jgi:hypothetical protein
MSDKPSFFSELKRRNVYKVAVAYAVVSWLLVQITTQVFPFFDIPSWAVRLVVLLLVLGFPVALILSWALEITPEGIKRESEIEPDKSITHHTGRKIVASLDPRNLQLLMYTGETLGFYGILRRNCAR